MQSDTCFACQKQGHWAKDCPEKPMNKPMPPGGRPPIINDHAIPDMQCLCGETCIVRISRTAKHPNRAFYTCKKLGCKFFQWCDESPVRRQNIRLSAKPNLMSSDRRHDSPQSPYPECSCGAGVCILFTAKSERNKGRKYFVCPVKKGQGACNFSQWQDSPGHVMNRDHIENSESIITPTLTTDDLENIYEDVGNNNVSYLSGFISPESAQGLKKLSSREPHVNDEKVELDFVVDDSLFPPIGDLRLSAEKKSVVAKPGICYRCGIEGHWAMDCLKPPSSPCYKGGKGGHWMKDCAT